MGETQNKIFCNAERQVHCRAMKLLFLALYFFCMLCRAEELTLSNENCGNGQIQSRFFTDETEMRLNPAIRSIHAEALQMRRAAAKAGLVHVALLGNRLYVDTESFVETHRRQRNDDDDDDDDGTERGDEINRFGDAAALNTYVARLLLPLHLILHELMLERLWMPNTRFLLYVGSCKQFGALRAHFLDLPPTLFFSPFSLPRVDVADDVASSVVLIPSATLLDALPRSPWPSTAFNVAAPLKRATKLSKCALFEQQYSDEHVTLHLKSWKQLQAYWLEILLHYAQKQ